MTTHRLAAPLALALLLLVAAPSAAQRSIAPGQTVSGELSTSDAVLSDGSHYRIYRLDTRAGERYRITLRSPDFDAYLAFGRDAGEGCDVGCWTDDDGAGGTDSRLVVVAPADGPHQIRVNSFFEGETGRYTLSVEALGQAPAAQTIRLGQTVTGRLTEDAMVAEDGTFYDVYRFEGRVGDRVRITMRSDDFDAFLILGMPGARFVEVAMDDDGAGGTDARIDFTLPDTGLYEIHAHSLFAEETGAYTLTLESIR